VLVSGLLALMPACSDLAGPRGEGPARDPLEVGATPATVGALLATPCEAGRIDPSRAGDDEPVLVDVVFGRPWSEAAADGPAAEELALVRRHQGEVLARFRVPAARIRIAPERIAELVGDEAWVSVREVPDPVRFDAVVTVDFGRPVGASELAAFRELGGQALEWHPGVPLLTGVLPDAAIPALRALLGPRSVTPERVYCPLG
jgi:hypothetical protein